MASGAECPAHEAEDEAGSQTGDEHESGDDAMRITPRTRWVTPMASTNETMTRMTLKMSVTPERRAVLEPESRYLRCATVESRTALNSLPGFH